MHFLMAVALIAPSVTSTAYAVETTSQPLKKKKRARRKK